MPAMSADVIVSYDGTANDEDAIALAAPLAAAGVRMAIAYVRHAREFDPERERIAQHDAEQLLERGAAELPSEVVCHVIVNPSTPAGLQELADAEGATMIIFGSEYRTSPGRAEPGTSAQTLLEGGSLAVAVAAAGLRAHGNGRLRTLSLAGAEEDGAAADTIAALADRLGADVAPAGHDADLIVVGSQGGGPRGRINLGGAARAALNTLRGSVLVVPRQTPPRL